MHILVSSWSLKGGRSLKYKDPPSGSGEQPHNPDVLQSLLSHCHRDHRGLDLSRQLGCRGSPGAALSQGCSRPSSHLHTVYPLCLLRGPLKPPRASRPNPGVKYGRGTTHTLFMEQLLFSHFKYLERGRKGDLTFPGASLPFPSFN